MEQYTAFTQLSLDVSQLQDQTLREQYRDAVKPDVCIYPKRVFRNTNDIIKMDEMPLLAVEILSPMQATYPLVSKVPLYFALGVQSVWIVYPTPRTVTVYQSPEHSISFSVGNIIDNTLNLTIPLSELFH